jgi:hypothetical protein
MGLLVVCLLLPSSKMLAATSFLEAPKAKAALTEQQRKAMAFVLGWNSKIILVQKTPKDRERLLLAIKREVRELGVMLHHPLDYYFTDPTIDQGISAQSFSEETFAQLKKTNVDVANHFGAAHNLLLNLAHIETPISSRKLELRELVTVLDVPDELKQVPDNGIPEWAAAIKEYFESSLPRASRPGKRNAGR